MKEVGFLLCKEEIEEIFKTVSPEDDNGELSIRYSEFITATLDYNKVLTAERLWGLFKYFD